MGMVIETQSLAFLGLIYKLHQHVRRNHPSYTEKVTVDRLLNMSHKHTL